MISRVSSNISKMFDDCCMTTKLDLNSDSVDSALLHCSACMPYLLFVFVQP